METAVSFLGSFCSFVSFDCSESVLYLSFAFTFFARSEVREHVNLLGFFSEWSDNGGGCEYGQLDVAIATQFPGSTILEQILSVTSPDISIPIPIPLRLSTAEENKHDRPVGQPWPVRCEVQLPKLSVELNPATNFGRGLEPVFRHLILGGRVSTSAFLIILLTTLSV